MKKIELQTRYIKCSIIVGRLNEMFYHGKVMIITNSLIFSLYKEKLLSCIKADEVFVCEIQDGEEFKNIDTVEFILNSAFKNRLDRNSTFIAFGGGVISDITGFVAGIYKRGINFITIPTTLLAQVDASIGGKTGINNVFGKNMIGIFNQPKLVNVDLYFLKTLSRREFISGIGEIIKMAVCFDKDFFTWLKSADLFCNEDDLEYAVIRSIEIKAMVVSKDELEFNVRMGLNYGHTFGHIIEFFDNSSKYLHGECVSIGMCMANELAVRLDKISLEDSNSIKMLLKRFGLPTQYKVSNVEEFYKNLFLDKKSVNDKIRFILPYGIGNMSIVEDISKDILFEVLSLKYD